jgi:predicted nucleic acid-binding protein
MIVVSNSSPLISLSAIGRLKLLAQLFGSVSIPRAVHREVAEEGAGRPGAAEIRSSAWITCCDVGNSAVVTVLQGKLDHGEAEAIALAVELSADLLLMDERLGRIEAARFGLRFVGTLGILIEARARGHLPEIKPALAELTTGAGFFMSKSLLARVLEAASE